MKYKIFFIILSFIHGFVFGQTSVLDLSTSKNKIVFFGSSYTEDAYAFKYKTWPNKLSNLSDYVIINEGQNGNILENETQRLRSNQLLWGNGLSFTDLKPTYIVFANLGNETVVYGVPNLDAYKNELMIAINQTKAFGAIPIIGTEHYGKFAGYGIDPTLYAIANEYNIDYWGIGVTGGLAVCSFNYAGFWQGTHPGIRTNSFFVTEWKYYFDQIPKPQTGIKLFRVRSDYQGGSPTVSQLNYDDINQRVRYFYELNTGGRSLSETDTTGWKYYDRLDEDYVKQSNTNEYAEIINGNNITFSNWVLSEFMIDKIGVSKITLKYKIDIQPDSVYIANNNPSSTIIATPKQNAVFFVYKEVYDAFNESVGEAFTSDATGAYALTYAGKLQSLSMGGYMLVFNSETSAQADAGVGNLTKTAGGAMTPYINHDKNYANHTYFFLSNIDQPYSRWERLTTGTTYQGGWLYITIPGDSINYFQYDKVRLLLYKGSTTFNLSGIEARYTGGVDKITEKKDFIPKEQFTELNDTTYFYSRWITDNGWTNVGCSLVSLPDSIEDYPPKNDSSYHIELTLNTTDTSLRYIKKTFNVGSVSSYRKISVRIICRLFPKIYNSTVAEDAYHTQIRQLTTDSYDLGTLVCGIGATTPYGIMKKVIDCGWQEVSFDTWLSPYQTSFDIVLYRDQSDWVDTTNYKNHTFPLQVYDVSVQVQNE